MVEGLVTLDTTNRPQKAPLIFPIASQNRRDPPEVAIYKGKFDIVFCLCIRRPRVPAGSAIRRIFLISRGSRMGGRRPYALKISRSSAVMFRV